MSQVIAHGEVLFKTKLMDREPAFRFARCLQGNSQYTEVLVSESGHSGRFYVTYRPVSGSRAQAMVTREQAKQDRRGDEQQDNYLVCADESGRFHWVANLLSGEVYECTVGHHCTCPHSHYRLQRPGLDLLCKHDRVVRLHIEQERVQPFTSVFPAADRRFSAEDVDEHGELRESRTARRMCDDFPADEVALTW